MSIVGGWILLAWFAPGRTSWHHHAEFSLSLLSLLLVGVGCWGWHRGYGWRVHLFQLIGVSPETSHADWSINSGNQSEGSKEYTKCPRNGRLRCMHHLNGFRSGT